MKTCKECNLLKPLLEFFKRPTSKDGLHYKCKICVSKRHQKYYFTHREDRCARQRVYNPLHKKEKAAWERTYKPTYNAAHKKEKAAYATNRRKIDPLFKIGSSLRTRLYLALKSKKWHKDCHFKEYIGCAPEELKSHLEKQFQPGMTWDNHTTDGWHIDHIIPLNSATTPEELYKLCHYSNLQPLWWDANLHKGSSHVS